MGDANDPEVYTAGVIATLSIYPIEIIQQVVDPRSGVPAKIKWLPTIAEVRKACDELYIPIRERAIRDERAKQQLAERDEFERQETDRQRRPTGAELKAKYGPTYGIGVHPDPEEGCWT